MKSLCLNINFSQYPTYCINALYNLIFFILLLIIFSITTTNYFLHKIFIDNFITYSKNVYVYCGKFNKEI